MHSIICIYSILQYHISQSYMFRSLIESPSEIHTKVTFHKTELVMCMQIKNILCDLTIDSTGYEQYKIHKINRP
jgi:hypothetical protein